jgi:hypothetical protein
VPVYPSISLPHEEKVVNQVPGVLPIATRTITNRTFFYNTAGTSSVQVLSPEKQPKKWEVYGGLFQPGMIISPQNNSIIVTRRR